VSESQPRIALGVSGGIAAYKAAEIVRGLRRQGAEVHVLMTRNARRFITPLTLQTLSGHPVWTGAWDLTLASDIQHISLARRLDAFLVAPATANVLAKMAHGLADDVLTTFHLAVRAPVLVAPAMNVWMWEHAATQGNLRALRDRGVQVVPPGTGELACGEEGVGRMAEPDDIVRAVFETAGPTREPFDPARFLSNPSTGRMGYALAAEARARGAQVTLISGPTLLPPPPGVGVVRVATAAEMFRATLNQFQGADLVLKAAAVSDYRPEHRARGKIKKDVLQRRAAASDGADRAIVLRLVPNPDILAELGRRKKPHQVLVGFAAESGRLRTNARHKLRKKNLDLVIANRIGAAGEGFEAETNRAVILDRQGHVATLPLMRKEEMASAILDRAAALLPPPSAPRRARRSR
jgi:phosphopantothenoylcysteine decarboxylase/phosphopantothenate--cysteine ligase